MSLYISLFTNHSFNIPIHIFANLNYIANFIYSYNASSNHFDINSFKICSINITHIWKLSSFNLCCFDRRVINLSKIKSHVIKNFLR